MQSISYTLIKFRFWTVSQIAFTADGIVEKQLRLKSLKTAKAAVLRDVSRNMTMVN